MLIVKLRKTTSTMDVARRLAENNPQETIVVLAEEQTAGRGRLDRSWESPKGGLWASIVLPSPPYSDLLSIVAGLSVANTLRKATGLDVKIKWPNDIVFEGKKMGGILVEIPSKSYAIIGVGVNVNNDPPLPTATSVKTVLGKEVDLDGLLKAIIEELNRVLKSSRRETLARYKALLSTIGKMVRIKFVDGKVIEGTAVDVADNGALILETPSGIVEVLEGDVERAH